MKLDPLRSLVTSVPGHFGPFYENLAALAHSALMSGNSEIQTALFQS